MPWQPDLIGFRTLFSNENKAGFASGSCVLLAGPPGGGKTTVALAIARSLMKKSEHRDAVLLYLSVESDLVKLRQEFGAFGWFAMDDQVFDAEHARALSLPDVGASHRGRGAGSLVDLVIDRAAREISQLGSRPILAVVDSVTAVLKDSSDHGERRREAHRFVQRLAGIFRVGARATSADGPAGSGESLLILTSEQSLDAEGYHFEPPPEEYVADCVLKLARKDTGAGRRLRVMRVTKSRGVNMRIGEHTFAIVTPDSLSDVIAETGLRDLVINQTVTAVEKANTWATVIFSPRPRQDAIGDANTRPEATKEWLSTGTPGLDAMLSGREEHWAKPPRLQTPIKVLLRGSTTLALGASGSGKTLLCLQFLAAQGDPSKTLYANFENTRAHVLSTIPGSRELKLSFQQCRFVYRRRSNLDVNLWLSEVCEAARQGVERIAIDGLSDLLSTIDPQEYSRIVETLLTSIRKASKGRATIFVTYEIPPDFSAVAPPTPGLSVTADNVLILRQIPILDELRSSIYVLKARGLSHERQVREIRIQESRGQRLPLSIEPGFEAWGNLLAGQPKPLSITLELFAENVPEKRLNDQLQSVLSSVFGVEVKTIAFTRPEITHAFEDAISDVSPMARSDIKILNIDEWWIREYGVEAEWRRAEGLVTRSHPLISLTQFYGPGHSGPHDTGKRSDFWVFELEKASHVRLLPPPTGPADAIQVRRVDKNTAQRGGTSGRQGVCEMLAVPAYIDYGLFCVNESPWRKLKEMGPKEGTECFAEVAATLPRFWTVCADGQFEAPEGQVGSNSVVDALWTAKQRWSESYPFVGFAFEMDIVETTVCSFLEFCWAFGSQERFLAENAVGLRQRRGDRAFIAQLPITRALRFLQFLVRHGLMPARTTQEDCRRALFMRQWYSTFCELADLCIKRQEPFNHVPVPFFPVSEIEIRPASAPDSRLIHAALHDVVVRLERILQRCRVAAEFRKDSEPERVRMYDLNSHLNKIREKLDSWDSQAPGRPAIIGTSRELRAIGDELLKVVGRSPLFVSVAVAAQLGEEAASAPADLPAAQWLDYRDCDQLIAWHRLRLDLIDAQLKGASIASVAYPQAALHASGSDAQGGRITALAGYACSGSWLVGSLRPCHSPRLAWKLMQEMTSLAMAVTRAEEGAGIPARKDFYEYHGNKSVKNAPHLTWNSLLTFAGCRARRRDRTVCEGIRFGDISELVYHHVTFALRAARVDPEGADDAAIGAVGSILEYVAGQIEARTKLGMDPCAGCTLDCASVLQERR